MIKTGDKSMPEIVASTYEIIEKLVLVGEEMYF